MPNPPNTRTSYVILRYVIHKVCDTKVCDTKDSRQNYIDLSSAKFWICSLFKIIPYEKADPYICSDRFGECSFCFKIRMDSDILHIF